MKIYIFADLEGISGVSGSSFVTADGARYATGCKYLTRDVNICAKACLEAGADEVIVRDGHGGGNSIIWENLIPGVKLMQGASPRVRFAGLEGCDAVILLGYHAMAGTPQAVMEHSYSSKNIQNIWVNGEKIGEFGIDTMIAGEHGLPVIMTSGCDKLCKEAKEFSPEVVTCQVKESTAASCSLRLIPKSSCVKRHWKPSQLSKPEKSNLSPLKTLLSALSSWNAWSRRLPIWSPRVPLK